jgi:hypothetical protein
MPSRSVMGQVVGSIDQGSKGVTATPVTPVLGQLEAVKQAVLDGKRGKGNCAAAPVLAVVLDAFAKDDCAAAVINKSPQKISDYKAGRRPLSFADGIALLLESRDAWQALRGLIDGYYEERELKPAEAVELLLTVASMNPAVMAQVQQIAAARHGVEPEEALRAIRMLGRIGPKRVTRDEE